jgi:CheY-like chemotaxis protein
VYSPAERRSAFQASTLDLRGRKVLVIEDDPDALEITASMVERTGATPLRAQNGAEGLAYLKRYRQVHLILCDLLMPFMDGFDFIERLHRDRYLSRIPVIAVTALGSEADFDRTFVTGFHGHLVKPISYEVLSAQLRRVLAPV